MNLDKGITCGFQLMARPEWMNGFGTMHGAEYVRIMDELAGVTADWYHPVSFVTRAMHDISISEAVYPRDVIRAQGTLLYTTRHCAIIETSLYVRPRYGRDEKRCAHGYFTMAAIDTEGKLMAIPVYDEMQAERRKRTEAIRAYIESAPAWTDK